MKQSLDERYTSLCRNFNAIIYCVYLERYTNKLRREIKRLKGEQHETRFKHN